ncbi:MAG: aminoacyl-tRNA hydrolase [Candidatus Omnitrophica bacterium]|nr:aminoacyl-tRNA hydrolase [Candidatus Omnitrophota bacterium]MCF7888104.1 aminoacyl-tRNA hydrolase [Candidatus Omnitrophota bacterium]
MKIIVGLGNPGKKYSENRHNIGFKIVDQLAGRYKIKLRRSIRQKAWLGELRIGSDYFLLVKPKTYMNASGLCVNRVLAKYKVLTEDLLVIYDDADLDLGVLRIKKSGSSAGHRGMASIIDALGTKEINRLKVGIGRPTPSRGDYQPPLTEYVLSNFSGEEKENLTKVINQAAAIPLNWFKTKKEKTVKINLGG